MLLLDKKDIIKVAKIWELPIWKNPCPSSGSTKRTESMEQFEYLCGGNSTRRKTAYNALTRWQLDKNLSEAYLLEEEEKKKAKALKKALLKDQSAINQQAKQ